MSDELIINGVAYVPACDYGPIKIVVLGRGYQYVGRVVEDDLITTIHGARSLVRWGTTKHLGELVNGPLQNTKLGDPCIVRARTVPQVLHTIEVSQDEWIKHIA